MVGAPFDINYGELWLTISPGEKCGEIIYAVIPWVKISKKVFINIRPISFRFTSVCKYVFLQQNS